MSSIHDVKLLQCIKKRYSPRNGPDAWCPSSQQHQAISFPGGIDAGQAFKNVKLVFSGTSEPMKQDPGLCSRLDVSKWEVVLIIIIGSISIA